VIDVVESEGECDAKRVFVDCFAAMAVDFKLNLFRENFIVDWRCCRKAYRQSESEIDSVR
jgi:hypothetical protein